MIKSHSPHFHIGEDWLIDMLHNKDAVTYKHHPPTNGDYNNTQHITIHTINFDI